MRLEYVQAHAALGKLLQSVGYSYTTIVMDCHSPRRIPGSLKLNKMP